RRREAVVDEAAEVLLEQVDDRECEERRHERGALLEDVAAVEDRADDRRVCRRAPDAELLERSHGRRLRGARRRDRLWSLWLVAPPLDGVALAQVRQPPLVVVVGVGVAAFLVRGEEAAERDHGARRPELRLFALRRGAGDPQRHGLARGVLHLRGDGSHPNQLVERELIAIQLAGQRFRKAERVAGRTNRLVCLLRVLHLALVAARRVRNVLGAVELARLIAGSRQRSLGQRRRVGAHVRDVAVLVETLRDAHRRLRGVAELATRLLLQRRGHERRARSARVRLALDARDGERRVLEPRREPARGIPLELERGGGPQLSGL